MSYIDCHSHIFFSPFPKDSFEGEITGEFPEPNMRFINKSIKDAEDVGVTHFIGVISNPNQYAFYQTQIEHQNIVNVLGISRNHAIENISTHLSNLKKTFENRIPHAIGEIGLDYYFSEKLLKQYSEASIKSKQHELFRKQIQLAKDLDIPIVVHAGENTDEDILKILIEEKADDIGGQIHGYLTNPNIISELLDRGFYFSCGYYHTTEKGLIKVAQQLPLEQLLIETDAPYHLIADPTRFISQRDIIFIAQNPLNTKEDCSKLSVNSYYYKNKKKIKKEEKRIIFSLV